MPGTAQQLLALADHYLDIEQPARSLDVLDRIDGSAMHDVQYWRLRGAALFALERFRETLRAVDEGLRLDPDNAALLYLMANGLGELGEPAEAERCILKALRLAPDEPVLLCKYAELAGTMGDFGAASRALDGAARISPADPEVARTRFLVATLKGERRESLAYGRAWVGCDPENARSHGALGLNLALEGRLPEAMQRLRVAAALDPSILQQVGQSFHEARVWAHWTLWPLRPIGRFGRTTVWGVVAVLLIGLSLLGLHAGVVAFGALCALWGVYCRIAPPVLRRILSRELA